VKLIIRNTSFFPPSSLPIPPFGLPDSPYPPPSPSLDLPHPPYPPPSPPLELPDSKYFQNCTAYIK